MHMMLKVVDQRNQTRYDTYTRQDVDIFDSVSDLREFLLQSFRRHQTQIPSVLGILSEKTNEYLSATIPILMRYILHRKIVGSLYGQSQSKRKAKVQICQGEQSEHIVKPFSMEVTKV